LNLYPRTANPKTPNGERRTAKRETITSEDEHDDEDEKRLMRRQKTEHGTQKTEDRIQGVGAAELVLRKWLLGEWGEIPFTGCSYGKQSNTILRSCLVIEPWKLIKQKG